jgi:hypothetical protein
VQWNAMKEERNLAIHPPSHPYPSCPGGASGLPGFNSVS